MSSDRKIPKGSRVTGEARAALAAAVKEKYESGQSIRTISAEIGRSYGFIHRLLDEAKVTFRGRGGAMRRRGAR